MVKALTIEDRIASLLQEVNKDKSIESVFMGLGGDGVDDSIPRGSSGILSLDIILGGGYPYGRLVEAFGAPQGGKSSLTLHAIAEAQKRGNIACLVDAEFSFSIDYAKKLGVQEGGLLVTQPDYGEQALDSAIQLVKKLSPGDVVVIDSVAALTPKAEIEGRVEDNHVGLQARMMSQALRTLTGEVSKAGIIMIFVNQTRQKIGMAYGNPTETPGGQALKFYASVRLDVKSIGRLKKGEEAIGHKLQIETVKNKTFPPFRKAVTRLIYGRGVPQEYDVLSMAEQYKVVTKNGAWYTYGGENLGQGFDNTADFLALNVDIMDKITRETLEAVGYKKP